MAGQLLNNLSLLDRAVVTSTSRRHVHMLNAQNEMLHGIAASKTLSVTVGDVVRYERGKNKILVVEILPRKNLLYRSFGKITKRIAANLDRLFIVTATKPLFNTVFVDRLLACSYHEHIPCTLVVNKSDLDLQDTYPLINIYERLGLDVILTSAKAGENIETFVETLIAEDLQIVALCGISGVGKSTILNQLIPGLAIKTAEVSEKTGQGKQTTSSAFAYPYSREGAGDLLIIDLPGVQNFGISHLSKQDAVAAFWEFSNLANACEFADCYHVAEPNCAVKQALEQGTIDYSRYESYLGMLEEIKRFKEY